MATEFKLPELGENIESADIIKVLVSPGDKIEIDQIVVEIETDKATVEVPSDVSGVIKVVNFKDGDNAKVGEVLFTLESDTTPKTVVEKIEKPLADSTVVQEKKVEKVKLEPEKSEAKPQVANKKFEFKMPELGENIESAEILKVLISEGDQIEVDQIVIEIETDKATVEVPTDISGKVLKVNVKDGDTAKIGQVIFTVQGVQSISEDKASTSPDEENKTEKEEAQPVSVKSEEKDSNTFFERRDMPKKNTPAAPSVRRFAREIGIDIFQISGSGPGGRISIDDVKTFAKSLNEKIAESAAFACGVGLAKEKLPDFSKYGEVKHEQMSNIRRKTAEHLSYAWVTVPHVTQFDKADITELEKLRKKYSALSENKGGKLTVTAILLKVIAVALKKFPQFNSSIDLENEEIIYKNYYNIGIAIDTERGLLVPVIRDVDNKNVIDLAVELNEISKKTRAKKLSLEEMQGGNFTISNLGGIGGTAFTPIVNSPEVAILGVSRGGKEPVFVDGEFVPSLMLPLSLSYDHRIIDGADAARFLRWIVEALENPFFLMLEG
jgi:pyruvate dehydrogenase E2 component (dihydrolipoyllysine-residue acetyltransferase)